MNKLLFACITSTQVVFYNLETTFQAGILQKTSLSTSCVLNLFFTTENHSNQTLTAVVIPLNSEGMGIGEWVIVFSENFEGMGMGMGMGMVLNTQQPTSKIH